MSDSLKNWWGLLTGDDGVDFWMLGFYQLSIHKVREIKGSFPFPETKTPQRLKLPFKFESQDTITRLSIIFIDYFINCSIFEARCIQKPLRITL